jgi:hypothetical protein
MSTSDLGKIAARLQEQRDVEETQRKECARIEEEKRQDEVKSREQERELLGLVEEVVAALNAQAPEPLLAGKPGSGQDIEYRFGTRTLRMHFFRPGELYADPEVPGRMNTLRERHVVHGGYIEIQERGEDREGWNLVLVRRSDAERGEWRIVETDVSALTAKVARHRPFATQARLFADNLACHWHNTMHVYVLKDKPLERDDVVKILEVFAGRGR